MQLYDAPIADEFNGDFGRDERRKPRIKIGWEVILKSEEKQKKKKKTKETTSHEQGTHDSRVWRLETDDGTALSKIR